MNRPAGLGKPVVGERGAKIGVYGTWGTGKTELLMSATKIAHLLVVDAEGRTQYYDAEADHGFEAIYSKNTLSCVELLNYAEQLHKDGQNVIFGVDGFSSMWFEQQEVAEQIGKTSRGTAKYSSWGPAKKPLKQFYARLYETPVDCIITMRSKPKYQVEKKGSSMVPKNVGYDVPDIERGLNYAVDLVVELHKDTLDPGVVLKPQNFWAIVVKTSGPRDNPLPIGTQVRDPSFAKLLALRLNGTSKFGIADGDVGLQVALATIKNGDGLKQWIATLGMEVVPTLGVLKEKFGGFTSCNLSKYIEAVWAAHEVLPQNKETESDNES